MAVLDRNYFELSDIKILSSTSRRLAGGRSRRDGVSDTGILCVGKEVMTTGLNLVKPSFKDVLVNI